MTQISGYQPPKFKERDRFFSKRTLWVMNLILIPLIYVLSQVGQEDSDDDSDQIVTATSEYMLSQVQFNRVLYNDINLHWANLDNAQVLTFGFVLNRQPIASLEIPMYVNVQTQIEGGNLWVQVEMPNNREVIYDALVFMKQWLPLLTPENAIVLTGELDEKIVGNLVENLMDNQGRFSEFYASASKYVQAIEAPQIGSEDFEIFYVTQLIIKSRILSNRIELSWDTKTPKRILGVNSVIDANWLELVDQVEFDQALEKLNASLTPEPISRQSITRYLMHQAGYNLPVDYFHTRALRYQRVDISQVNAQLTKLQEKLIKQ